MKIEAILNVLDTNSFLCYVRKPRKYLRKLYAKFHVKLIHMILVQVEISISMNILKLSYFTCENLLLVKRPHNYLFHVHNSECFTWTGMKAT